MAQDVVVPQMGESVLEGTILQWKVKIGDRVEINQPLVELMTDKVNVEIPAETAGILTAQFVKEGEVVPVGTRIATIDDGKSSGAAAKPAPAAVPAAAEPSAAIASAPPKPAAPVKATGEIGKGMMSPKVRMLIREYGVDPLTVIPTGKEGRVSVEDVMRAVEERSGAKGIQAGPVPSPVQPSLPTSYAAPVAAAPTAAAPREPKVKVQIPVFAPLPEAQRVTRTPLIGARKLIAEHMVKSVQTSPHVTTFEDIDFTELVKFRNQIKKEFRDTYGANLTFMPFIVKAACIALKEYPTINASLTEKEIIVKNYYNIGIAVARDEGLIVPVIKDADKKSIVEIAVEINSLGEKARTNRLKPDDVSDGTFSVTNAGMFGATASTPIIAQPQVAILGVHMISKRPWVVNDQIVIRDISSFGMSFDHRLIDGHTAVQFLHRVHEFLADPTKLLVHLR
ncbi:MAG: 2-oxo acid dehydrogenase subunit E2 [candidate division Zixibacteria bacterium]|nr:2-oxo acid dehydrogenase subunit E2 [candidate division Zixibacteria bacterium]